MSPRVNEIWEHLREIINGTSNSGAHSNTEPWLRFCRLLLFRICGVQPSPRMNRVMLQYRYNAFRPCRIRKIRT